MERRLPCYLVLARFAKNLRGIALLLLRRFHADPPLVCGMAHFGSASRAYQIDVFRDKGSGGRKLRCAICSMEIPEAIWL